MDRMSNGTDTRINTRINGTLEAAVLEYNTGTLENWNIVLEDWKTTGLDGHIMGKTPKKQSRRAWRR